MRTPDYSGIFCIIFYFESEYCWGLKMVYARLSVKLTPMVACPFGRGYREYEPCGALKPYVRCFWTSEELDSSLIIPDLCADIIFDFDKNTVFFCGVNDTPFKASDKTHSFGIRFYAWTAALFSEDTLRGTLNGDFELGVHFRRLEREFAPQIFAAETTEQRIALSELFLLKNLHERHNGLFTQAMGEIIERRGTCAAGEISKELHISSRQLERVFAEYSGLSSKKMAALVRYQCLWRDILLERDFSASEKALEYGYVDQSHMLNDFRRFHTMSPKQARKNALGAPKIIDE